MTKVQFDQFSREVVSIAENGKETQVFGSDDVLQ